MGVLSQLIEEEQANAPLMRGTTKDSISLINFERDIDNILESELIQQESSSPESKEQTTVATQNTVVVNL